MADEKTAQVAFPTSVKVLVLLFALVVVILAIAIGAFGAIQAASARDLHRSVDALRHEMRGLRQDSEEKDTQMAELTTKISNDVARLGQDVKTLVDADTRLQSDLTGLRTEVSAVRVRVGLPAQTPEEQTAQDEFTRVVQKEVTAQLVSISERIEKLKTEVILKETRLLQDQITETKGRIGQAEKDVQILRQALNEADLPSLKARVQEVDRDVMQAEADVKALAKALDAFRTQVTGFFGEVFYNDPWGKYNPDKAAKAQ